MKNSVDIVRPLLDDIETSVCAPIQVIGGIGSAALTHEQTEILPDEKLVVAPKVLFVPQYRETGTLRDFDCLVMTSDEDRIAQVEAFAQEHLGEELVVSIFGLKKACLLEEQTAAPFMSTAKVFLSDRYVVLDEAGRLTAAKKALFPFAVDMDLETLETWQLVIGNGQPRPIPHPGATILNYLTRSISGLRTKDVEKVNSIGASITAKAPEVADWVVDGPGASQFRLARILHTLREPTRRASLLTVDGLPPVATLQPAELLQAETFMLENPYGRAAAFVLRAAQVKARGLHTGESFEPLVTFFQKNIETRMDTIIKNN